MFIFVFSGDAIFKRTHSHFVCRAGMVPSSIKRAASLAGILIALRPTRTFAMRRLKTHALAVEALIFNISANCSIRNKRSSTFSVINTSVAALRVEVSLLGSYYSADSH